MDVVRPKAKKVEPSKYTTVGQLKPGEGFILTAQSLQCANVSWGVAYHNRPMLVTGPEAYGIIPGMVVDGGCPMNFRKDTWVLPTKVEGALKQKLRFANIVANTGADPEIFVKRGGGDLMPAFEFLPSQKDAATLKGVKLSIGRNIGVNSEQCNSRYVPVYYDGFQAEFSPTEGFCHAWGCDRIRHGLQEVWRLARKKDPKAELSLSSVEMIDPDLLISLPDEQVALGCSPSDNAYGEERMLVPEPRALAFRVAGGHIHLGLTDPYLQMVKKDKSAYSVMVKWMDVLAAIPSVAIFEGIEDPLRRQIYGRAGEYRKKPYGIEYRTLSNAWLGHPAMMHVMWDLTRKAAGGLTVRHSMESPTELGMEEKRIRDIINNCDAVEARKFLKEFRTFYNTQAGTMWGGMTDKFFSLCDKGALKVFKDYRNLSSNWKFDDYWEAHTNNSQFTWGRMISDNVLPL